MNRLIRLAALVVALAGLGLWLAAGAHRSWTKTSVPKTTVDPVTGIEGINYERHFVPGVDFLGATLLGAGALAVVSLLIPSKKQHNQ